MLGRREVALYAVLVRGRPTWISWAMVPAALRLWSDQRTPDELSDAGLISADAYRIAQALERAGGTLVTGDLRREANFPTGKDQRAAFLKAIAELDARLLLAKTFAGDGDEMQHNLITTRYPDLATASERLCREDALDAWLRTYLPGAVYALPTPLAKHLKLPEADLRAATRSPRRRRSRPAGHLPRPERDLLHLAWQARPSAQRVRCDCRRNMADFSARGSRRPARHSRTRREEVRG